MQETEKIWMNGELVPWADAKVHVLSHAMHYGSGVFEGIRAYATDRGPAVFRLMDHLRRLERSSEVYFMQLPYGIEELRQATHEVIAANGLDTCYVRPLAFRGYGELGINPLKCPIEVIIAVWPWGAYLGEEALEHGVRVMTSSWRRIGPNTLPATAKASGQYLNSQLAKMEAMHSGYDEAILLNEQGYLADGSGENVFMVHDGVLSTPPTTASCLPGITRDTVIRLARGMGYEVREVDVVRSDLYHADEVFFTGTAAEITPIRSIDEHEIGAGPITKRIQTRVLRDHLGPLGALARVPRLPRRDARQGVKVQAARQIPLSRPDIGPQEEEYVLAALRSGVLGLGPYARNFEKEFAAFCGSEHAVSVSSGTAACTCSCAPPASARATRSSRAPISFVASANVMLYERATPVFADVDPDTFVLDPAAVEAAITPRTRGDPAGARVRLSVRHGRARRDRREALARDHRGRLRGGRQRVPGPQNRGARAARGLRLLPEQADDDGRGRHGHHRRRRARRAAALARQSGPLRLRRLARARQARLQLPHGRAVGGCRPGADRAPRRYLACVPQSRPATTSCSRASRASRFPPRTAPATCARGSSLRDPPRRRPRPQRRDGRAAGTRSGLPDQRHPLFPGKQRTTYPRSQLPVNAHPSIPSIKIRKSPFANSRTPNPVLQEF